MNNNFNFYFCKNIYIYIANLNYTFKINEYYFEFTYACNYSNILMQIIELSNEKKITIHKEK